MFRSFDEARELAQRTPGNFIGVQASQPVDDRGVLLLDQPPVLKAAALSSRAALNDWFEGIAYETQAPAYSHTILAVDKTKLVTVQGPDGTKQVADYLTKTMNVPAVPKGSPSTRSMPWGLIAIGGAAVLGLVSLLAIRPDPKIEAAIEAGKKRYKEAYPTRAARRAHDAEIAAARKEWRDKGWRPGQPIPK